MNMIKGTDIALGQLQRFIHYVRSLISQPDACLVGTMRYYYIYNIQY